MYLHPLWFLQLLRCTEIYGETNHIRYGCFQVPTINAKRLAYIFLKHVCVYKPIENKFQTLKLQFFLHNLQLLSAKRPRICRHILGDKAFCCEIYLQLLHREKHAPNFGSASNSASCKLTISYISEFIYYCNKTIYTCYLLQLSSFIKCFIPSWFFRQDRTIIFARRP